MKGGAGLSGVTSIAAGAYHSLALKTDGTLIAWGQNYVQTQVPAGLNQVVAMAGGNAHSLVVTTDTTAPETTITGQPSNPTNSPSATFSFASSEAGSHFECSLDGAAFTACSSTQNYNNLSNGSHTFQVRAIDFIGNLDATPASYTWTVSLPTATPTNTATPTTTATNTAVPPTATATATNTAVPPTATPTATATNTAVPPTATATATNTAVPPTATPTNTPAAPVANNDSYATNEDAPLTIAAPGVLSNDSDIDSPTLVAVLVSNPANGSLTLNADGSFVYTPNANFNGSDSFTYAANDGWSNSNAATVQLTVNAVNDAPVAQNDSYTVNQEMPLIVPAHTGLLINDSRGEGGQHSATLVSNPSNGSLTLNANGGFSYLPNVGFVGQDSFTYTVSDGLSTSNVATVSITVNAATDAQSPVGITGSSAVEVIGAPCSVAPNALENDTLMRLFPERLAYALPSAVTVTAPNGSTQTIAQGTLVDSYYLHADWINGGQNVAKLFKGNVSFSQPILGVIKTSNGLLASNAMLGAVGTAYGNTTAQGLEYDDNAWFSNEGRTLHLWLNVYDTSDALRIITPARPGLTLGGAVEGIGAPCSVVETKLESDTAIRFFAEHLNYVLPAPITVDGFSADGVDTQGMVLPQGSRVNVYYVHADMLGDGQGKQLSGSVSFDTPILAVLVDSNTLMNTHNTLGATWHPTIKTAYSARGDQSVEAGDRLSIQQNRINFVLSGNADTDQIRIITAAPGTAATISAAASDATVETLLPDDMGNVIHGTDELTAPLPHQIFLPLVNN